MDSLFVKRAGTYPESVDNSNPLKFHDKFWLTRAGHLPIFAQIRGFP
jgi:hypothetical protein